MTLIAAFDPGTVITGYAFIKMLESGQLELIDFGCIKPPSKYKLSDRYLVIYDAVAALLDRYQPDSAAVESQFVKLNPQSALKLGMAKGMIVLAVKQRKIPLHEYAPKKTKLAATGHGNASKGQVQRMMQLLFKLPILPEPEDAADALAAAVCHAHALQTNQVLGIEV